MSHSHKSLVQKIILATEGSYNILSGRTYIGQMKKKDNAFCFWYPKKGYIFPRNVEQLVNLISTTVPREWSLVEDMI